MRTKCNNTCKALGMVSAQSMCSISIGVKTFVERCKRGWGGQNSLITGAFSPCLQDLTSPQGLSQRFLGGFRGTSLGIPEIVHSHSPALSPVWTSPATGHLISQVLPPVHSLRGYTSAVCTSSVVPKTYLGGWHDVSKQFEPTSISQEISS